MKPLIPRLTSLLLLILLIWSISFQPAGADSATISGTVEDGNGQVEGAHVRVRATGNFTLTADDGSFNLGGLTAGEEIEVTAWSDGYYVASTLVVPPASAVELLLRPYHTQDDPTYTWIDPTPGSSDKACGDCHPQILPQWQANAHAGSVSNPRFYSMYNGTDTSGAIPVAPGFVNDFPGTAGNCASCHAPGSAVDGYLVTDLNAVRGELTAGIHCDYCHKVGGVFLDPSAGSVYPNSPGVISQRILRPPAEEQIFIGPYDDIPDPDTYLPLFSESQFCAPCHQFSFWGIPIYESFNEWLGSPYAQAGITCQDCHMPPNGDTHYALPEVGGLPHPPESIPSHLQLGAESVNLLQNSVDLSVQMNQIGSMVEIEVVITNSSAGHHVPTDHPGRHLILHIVLEDESGLPLEQLSGPVVPGWGGFQAGEPGKAFGKILRDLESGKYPVVSYWKQTSLLADNRIPAGAHDRTKYTFSAPSVGEQVTLEVELRFRRLFQDLMQEKGWETPDIIMEQTTQTLVIEPWWQYYLPISVSP